MSVCENFTEQIESVDEIDQDSLHSEVSKLRMKDEVVHYESLLANNNFITSESSSTISHEAMLMGKEIYERTTDVLAEKNTCD